MPCLYPKKPIGKLDTQGSSASYYFTDNPMLVEQSLFYKLCQVVITSVIAELVSNPSNNWTICYSGLHLSNIEAYQVFVQILQTLFSYSKLLFCTLGLVPPQRSRHHLKFLAFLVPSIPYLDPVQSSVRFHHLKTLTGWPWVQDTAGMMLVPVAAYGTVVLETDGSVSFLMPQISISVI
jgi:hypothetical protein